MMKTLYRVISVMTLALLLMLFVGASTLARGFDVTYIKDLIPTQLTFDKRAINDGEQVTATLELDNPTEAGLYNVSLKTTLPDGLHASTTEKTYDQIAGGQKINYSFKISNGEISKAALLTATKGSNPHTGYQGPHAIFAVLMLTILILGVIFFKGNTRHKQKMMSLILCLSIGTQLGLAAFPKAASAAGEETTAEESELPTSLDNITYDVTSQLVVDGEEQNVTTTVTIEKIAPLTVTTANYEPMTTETEVAADARFFNVVATSEGDAFSDSITAGDIELANAFHGVSIDEINLLDEHTVSLKMSGQLDENDESCGVLYFDKDSFKQEGDKVGVLVVDVMAPLPYFAEGTDNVRVNDDGTADIAFCVDTAEFADTADAAHFSFDNPAIQPVALTVPSTQAKKDGVLKVTVNGITDKGQILDELDGATMTIDSAGLNCDSLELDLELEEERITAELTLDTVTADPQSPSTAAAVFTGRVSSLNGSVNLTPGSVSLTEDTLTDAVISPVTIENANTFTFSVTIDNAELQRWYEEEGEEGLRAFFAHWASNENIVLAEGSLIDAYGVPVAADDYEVIVYDNMLASNSAASTTDLVSKILTIVNSFAKDAPIGGIAGILGLGSLAMSESKESMSGISDSIAALSESALEINKMTTKIQNEVNYLVDATLESKISKFQDSARSINFRAGLLSSSTNDILAQLAKIESIDSQEYKDLMDQLNVILGGTTTGGQGFVYDTYTFGQYILGEGVVGSVLDDYVTLYNRRYNWESQTTTAKSEYWASNYQMYIKAYMISMCYMNVNNKDHMYDAQIAKMKDQFNSINTKWTTFQESLILPTDKDRNLVDKQLYTIKTANTVTLDPLADIHTMLGDKYKGTFNMKVETLFNNLKNDKKITSYQEDNKKIISVDTLNTMKNRLSSSGHKTLYDEMTAVGMVLPTKYLYIGNESLNVEDRLWIMSIVTAFVGASGTGSFRGDVYNLETNALEKNVKLVKFRFITGGDFFEYNLDSYKSAYNKTPFVFKSTAQ